MLHLRGWNGAGFFQLHGFIRHKRQRACQGNRDHAGPQNGKKEPFARLSKTIENTFFQLSSFKHNSPS